MTLIGGETEHAHASSNSGTMVRAVLGVTPMSTSVRCVALNGSSEASARSTLSRMAVA
jgi:hypothetical protein